MTLAAKLGKSFEAVQAQVKIRTINIDLENVKFDLRVRIPLKKEMEEITRRIVSPDAELVEKIYEQLAAPIRKTLEEGGEDFVSALNKEKPLVEVLENDLVVQGNSVRNIAQFSAIDQTRTTEYFHLLISENGEPVTETYDDIIAEFPEFVIKEIVQTIEAAIKPDYKTVKKN